MNKIEIREITRTKDGISATVFINGNQEIIKTTINEEYIDKVVTDRIDAFVWGFMFFALCKGYDIVSSMPITDELYYNLEYHFIGALTNTNTSLHKIHIKAPLVSTLKSNTQQIIATGISCGVDSLYTIAKHTSDVIPKNNRINTLTFFNAGSSMREIRTMENLIKGRLLNAQNFAKEYGFNFIFIDTNLPLIINKYIPYSHIENNTYMALFCSYHLQRDIKTYYYSSGYSYAEFTLKRERINSELDSEHYDLLTLSMASINGMKFYSAGGEVNRVEKTKYIISYAPTPKYLNVCVNTPKNDGTCFKCIRTLLTLDALNVLNEYRAVFDIDYYYKHRSTYIRRMYIDATFKNNSFYKEILPFYKEEITLYFKFQVLISIIRNKIFDLLK